MTDAYTLAHVRGDKIEIVCQQCQRRGSYSVAKLIAKYGSDMILTEVRRQILLDARCPDVDNTSNICRAKFTRDSVLSWTKEVDLDQVARLLK